MVLGASRVQKLEEVMKNERVLLERWVVEQLDGLWKAIETDAQRDNYATYKRLRDAVERR